MKPITITSIPMQEAAQAMEAGVAALFKEARSGQGRLKAAVAELDAYVRMIQDLHRERLPFGVSYSYVSEPVLSIGNLNRLIADVSYRSGYWWSLRRNGSSLSNALVGHAQTIAQGSENIQNTVSKLEMVGGRTERWEVLADGGDLALSFLDRIYVRRMAAQLSSLRMEIETVQLQLFTYLARVEDFRETHRRELQPELDRVVKALETVEVRACTLRFEPFWTNCRKATFEEEDRVRLKAIFGAQGLSLAGVHSNIEKLHSAWQAIGTYAESADRYLKTASRQRELARFMIYFKIFLGQWKQVAVQAEQMREAYA